MPASLPCPYCQAELIWSAREGKTIFACTNQDCRLEYELRLTLASISAFATDHITFPVCPDCGSTSIRAIVRDEVDRESLKPGEEDHYYFDWGCLTDDSSFYCNKCERRF